MKADISRLISVSSHAKKIGKTTTWVYKLIKRGELKTMSVDGRIFIIT